MSDVAVASAEDVLAARQLVLALVTALMKRGANFVIPVDAEPVRAEDRLPICFDWLVWRAIKESLAMRPAGVPGPLAVAIQHEKNEEQIPAEYVDLWDSLRSSDLVRIENAAHWNMNAKRMETQSRYGDILITLGGTDGVLYLANLYHDAGKPVVPLNLALSPSRTGSRRLSDFGLTGSNASRLFPIAGHGDFEALAEPYPVPRRQPLEQRVEALIELLEALERPPAFAVRLLDTAHQDFAAVQDFFDVVVKPVVEGELGYRLYTVDGSQAHGFARIDEEIFARLHRSAVVIADTTGGRPNCFIELGYAFGRGLPTVVTARAGSEAPFDIKTFSALHWKTTGTADERREAFRKHWQATRSRPPLVPTEDLIP